MKKISILNANVSIYEMNAEGDQLNGNVRYLIISIPKKCYHRAQML